MVHDSAGGPAREEVRERGVARGQLLGPIDLLGDLGRRRLTSGHGPVLVGFAAETDDLVKRATAKLEQKHADLIVANDVSRSDAGFDVDTNAVTIVGGGGAETLPLQSKSRVAAEVLDRVERLLLPDPHGSRTHR